MSFRYRLGPGRTLLQRAQQHASLSVLFRTAEPAPDPAPAPTSTTPAQPAERQATETEPQLATETVAPAHRPSPPGAKTAPSAPPVQRAPDPTDSAASPSVAPSQAAPTSPAVQRTPEATDSAAAPPAPSQPAAMSPAPTTSAAPPDPTDSAASPPVAPSQAAPTSPAVQRTPEATDSAAAPPAPSRPAATPSAPTTSAAPPVQREQASSEAAAASPAPSQPVSTAAPVQRSQTATPPAAPQQTPPKSERPIQHSRQERVLRAINKLHRQKQDTESTPKLSWNEIKARAKSPQPGQVHRRAGSPPARGRKKSPSPPAPVEPRRQAEVTYRSPKNKPKNRPLQAPAPQTAPETTPEPEQGVVNRALPKTAATTPPASVRPTPPKDSSTSQSAAATPPVQRTAEDDAPSLTPAERESTPPATTADGDDVQRTPDTPRLPMDPASVPQTRAGDSTGGSNPGASVQRTPLEEAWAVEQTDKPTLPSESPPAPKQPQDPESNTKLSQILRQVSSERPSDSSIELVTPRQPRPAPPSPPTAQRTPAEETPPDGDAPIATTPEMVPTEIGPLPSDLWDLVGETPPTAEASTPPKLNRAPADKTVNRAPVEPSPPPAKQSPSTPQPPAPEAAVSSAGEPQSPAPVQRQSEDSEDASTGGTPATSSIEQEIADNSPEDRGLPFGPGEIPKAEDVVPSTEELGALVVYVDETEAEASGINVVPLMVKRQGTEEELVVYTDAEKVQLLVQATERPQEESISAYRSAEDADANLENVAPLMAQRDEAEETATVYVDGSKIDSFFTGAETHDKDGVLPVYADEDSALADLGNAIPLLVREEGEEETFLVYTNAAQIDDFLSQAETQDSEGTLITYADEDIAAENIDAPVGLLIQPQGGQEKFFVYASGEALEELMALAEAAGQGTSFVGYAEEDAAAEDLENPVQLLIKRPGQEQIFVLYTEEEELETFLETAEPYQPDHMIEGLARQIYTEIKHRLAIERERNYRQ